jgi:hypothetical protein
MRIRRRESTSTIITDKAGAAYLDLLNAAITTVLEERTWKFQSRSDGVLHTAAKIEFTGGFVAQSVNGFTVNAATGTITSLAKRRAAKGSGNSRRKNKTEARHAS